MAASKKSHTVGEELSTTIIFPKNDVLTDLLEAKRNAKKRSQSINGTLGEKIGSACENDHLDRKAFSIVAQLEAMDDERLHVTWHSILHYAKITGVVKRATAQEEMFEPGETSAEPTGMFADAKAKGKETAKDPAKGKDKAKTPPKAKTKAEPKETGKGGSHGGLGGANVVAGPGRQVAQAAGKAD